MKKLAIQKQHIVSKIWAVRTFFCTIMMFVFLSSGCSSIGPQTIDRDRFDYVSAISEFWKRQTLLNLVKTRYQDAPVFMDIASVITQYGFESQVQLGASWANTETQTMGMTGKYTDRPTITYSPLMGERFARSMMTPIPTNAILFLVQSGFPVDYVLRICVQTMNGLDNRFGANMMGRDADPKFYQLLALLRSIQIKGGLGMRVEPEGERKAVIMFFPTY